MTFSQIIFPASNEFFSFCEIYFAITDISIFVTYIFFLYFKFLCLLYVLKFVLIWCLFIILFSSFIHSSTRIIFTHTFYAKWCLEFVKNICHASSKWLLILHLEEWSVLISIPKKGNAKEQFKLSHNFTCQQSNGQNSPSQASTVQES